MRPCRLARQRCRWTRLRRACAAARGPSTNRAIATKKRRPNSAPGPTAFRPSWTSAPNCSSSGSCNPPFRISSFHRKKRKKLKKRIVSWIFLLMMWWKVSAGRWPRPSSKRSWKRWKHPEIRVCSSCVFRRGSAKGSWRTPAMIPCTLRILLLRSSCRLRVRRNCCKYPGRIAVRPCPVWGLSTTSKLSLCVKLVSPSPHTHITFFRLPASGFSMIFFFFLLFFFGVNQLGIFSVSSFPWSSFRVASHGFCFCLSVFLSVCLALLTNRLRLVPTLTARGHFHKNLFISCLKILKNLLFLGFSKFLKWKLGAIDGSIGSSAHHHGQLGLRRPLRRSSTEIHDPVDGRLAIRRSGRHLLHFRSQFHRQGTTLN